LNQGGLRKALRACRGLFAWSILFSAGINLLYLAPSIFMMQVYDRVLSTGGMGTLGLMGAVLLFALSVLAVLDWTRLRIGARVGLRLNRLLARTVIGLGFQGGARGVDVKRTQAARDFDALRQVFSSPAINSLMSRQVPDDAQGELQGAINATNSLASILGPLLATQLFSYFTQAPKDSPGYFPGAPFLGAGMLVIVAAMLFIYTARRFDLMHRPPVAKKQHVHEAPQPGQQTTPPHEDADRDDTRGPTFPH